MTNGDGAVRGPLQAGRRAGRFSVGQPAPGGRWATAPSEALGQKPRRKVRVAPKRICLPSLCTFVLFASVYCLRQFVSYDACVISMGTSVHDACVNSGRHMNPDACARTNSCSWAHAHGGGPGTKTLRQCSGNQIGRLAVNTAPRTASLEHYFTAA